MPRSESANSIFLRNVTEEDIPAFFEQQLDPDANHMAAFTAPNPADGEAFTAHWARIRGDRTIIAKTVLCEGRVAGHVGCFVQFGEREVTYWLGKDYWGKGIATLALSQLLGLIQERPLYARAAKDNTASLRVLEKCGFVVTGYNKDFANARGEEIEEVILRLDAERP